MSQLNESDIRRRYLAVDTSNVADVLDSLGLHHQGLAAGFGPRTPSAPKLAGWAHTIRGQMTPYAFDGGDPEKMRACETITPDSVTVWAGAGVGVCFFGELIALGMQERGCTGALVDGGIRDVRWIDQQRFPVFARYSTPIQSIGRWKVTGSGVPVVLPGATASYVPVHPGDFVLGDIDGAIVVPRDVAEEVLERAETLGGQEEEIRAHLRGGLSLDAALARFGHV